MAGQKQHEVMLISQLDDAKSRLTGQARAIKENSFLVKHPYITLTSAFFVGVLTAGAMGLQAQMAQMTVKSLKKEVLRQLF